MRAESRTFTCEFCKQEVETKRGGGLATFCSKKCYGLSRKRRIDNPFRYIDKVGHMRLRYWDDDKGKYIHIFEHRFVWEQANGSIPDGYIVHHRDEDKTNNQLDNLEIMLRSEHAKHHLTKYATHDERKAEYARRRRESRKVSK